MPDDIGTPMLELDDPEVRRALGMQQGMGQSLAAVPGRRGGIGGGMPVADANKPAPATIAAPTPAGAGLDLPGISVPQPTSALSKQRMADQAELQRLDSTGSGIHQLGQKHHILGGLAKVADTIGSILLPGITARIPGTSLHHEMLERQQRGKVSSDLKGEQEEALAEQEQAKAAELRNPVAKTHPAHISYDQGIPVSVTDKTGEVWDVNDPKLPEELKPLVERANAAHAQHVQEGIKPEKPNERVEDIKDYLEANHLDDTAANREKARMEIAKRAPQARVEVNPPKGDQGVLMSVPDGNGGHRLVRIQPGEVIPEGSATPTQAASVDVKNEQGLKAGEDALRYADDYIKTGAFSGPGDEALMEKFFELAKPSSGFRMTQAQIDMLKNAQSYMNSVEAKFRHATTGTWFSDDLRQQIASTMTSLAKSRKAPAAAPKPNGPGKWNPKTGRYE